MVTHIGAGDSAKMIWFDMYYSDWGAGSLNKLKMHSPRNTEKVSKATLCLVPLSLVRLKLMVEKTI